MEVSRKEVAPNQETECNLLNAICLSIKTLKLSSSYYLHHIYIGFPSFIPLVMDPPPPADEPQPPGPPGFGYSRPLTSCLWFLCCCGLFTACCPDLLPRAPPPPL